MNLYSSYVKKTQEYLSTAAELNKYICDFFAKENLGVFVTLDHSLIIMVEYQPQRDKDFDPQILHFHNVVQDLCEDLNLHTTYKESRCWDTCNDFPIFGKEIVYLVGDR